MRRMIYIFIFAVALFATSCGKGEHSENSAPTENPDTTLSVANSEGQQEISNSDSEQRENTNGRDASILKYLVILSSVLSFFTLLSALKVSSRNRRLEKSINDIAKRLGTSVSNIETKISQIKTGIPNLNNRVPNQEVPISAPVVKRNETTMPKSVNVFKDDTVKRADESTSTKSTDTTAKRIIYLGINSEDCFFDAKEKQTDSSKFVAEVSPDGKTAKFSIIDVKRIKSANVLRAVKQEGRVAIEDANGIKSQIPGVLRQISDHNGTYWIIEERVIVEFM